MHTQQLHCPDLEPSPLGGRCTGPYFFAGIECHPYDANVKLAFAELLYFTSSFTLLGVYPAARKRG